MTQSKISILNRLYTEASKSLLNHQLAAAIIKNNKIISEPCCNSQRNVCRGEFVESMHAEATAIIKYYGKSLSFDKKRGWCFLRSKERSKKGKQQNRFDCDTG
jgi:hypothetical protein